MPQNQHQPRERGGMDLSIFIFVTLWCGTWGRGFVVALALVRNGWAGWSWASFLMQMILSFQVCANTKWLWQGPGIKVVLRIIHEKVHEKVSKGDEVNPLNKSGYSILFPVFLHQKIDEMIRITSCWCNSCAQKVFPVLFQTYFGKESTQIPGRGEEQGSNTLGIENRSLIYKDQKIKSLVGS